MLLQYFGWPTPAFFRLKENQFSVHEPEVLARTMWFLLTLHFGHRARHEARQIKFVDIALKKDEASGEEYLEWTTERERVRPAMTMKMNTKDLSVPKLTKQATANVQCLAPKNLYTGDQNHRKSPQSPFFLAIRHRRNPEDKIGFVNSPMGKNKIGQFLSSATKNLPMSTSSKFTNHCVRKTCIKTLLDSGVSHNNVAQNKWS